MKGKIQRDWESFAAAVLPPGAPDVQRREMRRAFFGGAWAMLCEVRRIGDDSVSEEDGVKALDDIAKECEGFRDAVVGGRA